MKSDFTAAPLASPAGSPPASSAPSARKKAIFLNSSLALGVAFEEREHAALRELLDFVVPPLSPTALAASTDDFSAVEIFIAAWGMPRLDAPFFQKFPAVKMIFYAAGSVRQFMTAAAWDRGIRVTTAAGVNAIPVAEFTFAQIILSLKNTYAQARATRQDRTIARQAGEIAGTFGSTVGLLSLGEIGRRVAGWLTQLDVKVIAYDPYAKPELARRLGLELCSLEEVFARADVVSCHTPSLPTTERMVKGSHFSALKPNATFINTARGSVVAEDEMIAVLRARPDLHALLDVTYPDPPAPDSPLFDLPNVILTPHIAGSLDRECVRMGRFIVAEVQRYLENTPLEGEINRQQASLLA